MHWSALFVAFFVAHLVGDFLFQTDWQATNKSGGLSRGRTERRALCTHILTYTIAFVPVLAWFADERTPAGAVAVALAVSLPHLAIDHGRAVPLWIRHVKKNPMPPPPALSVAVDQSMHMACLLAVAVLAVA